VQGKNVTKNFFLCRIEPACLVDADKKERHTKKMSQKKDAE